MYLKTPNNNNAMAYVKNLAIVGSVKITKYQRGIINGKRGYGETEIIV